MPRIASSLCPVTALGAWARAVVLEASGGGSEVAVDLRDARSEGAVRPAPTSCPGEGGGSPAVSAGSWASRTFWKSVGEEGAAPPHPHSALQLRPGGQCPSRTVGVGRVARAPRLVRHTVFVPPNVLRACSVVFRYREINTTVNF